MEVKFSKNGAKIMRGSKVLCTANRKGRLYELDILTPSIESAMVTDSQDLRTIWHRRYGHIGNNGLAKLIQAEMVEGIDNCGNVELHAGVWILATIGIDPFRCLWAVQTSFLE